LTPWHNEKSCRRVLECALFGQTEFTLCADLRAIPGCDMQPLMLQAYVGIISQRGIEAFWPEGPHTVRFLAKRSRRTWDTVCFWTVLSDDAAMQLTAALHAGRSGAALNVLQSAARDFGTLLPFDE
jgi:hypothetical protein